MRLGESQGSFGARVERLDAGERETGMVVGDASLALVGGVSLGVVVGVEGAVGRGRTLPSAGRFCGVAEEALSGPVRTVFRLLSAAEAAAVFLFASARSFISIVSCAAAAVVSALVLVSLLQPVTATRAGNKIIRELENAFIRLIRDWFIPTRSGRRRASHESRFYSSVAVDASAIELPPLQEGSNGEKPPRA